MIGRRPFVDAILAGTLIGLLGEVMVLRLNPEVAQNPSTVLLGVPLWMSWGASAAGLPILLMVILALRLRSRRNRLADHWWAPQLAALAYLLAAVLGHVNARLHPEFLSASGHRILWQDSVAWLGSAILALMVGAGVRWLDTPRWARVAFACLIMVPPVARVLKSPTAPPQSLEVAVHPLGTPARRVVVVGLEGFDSRVFLGRVAGARDSTMTRLDDRGAWGRYRPYRPFLRASLWTSLATGTEPGRHGVKGQRAWRLAPLFNEPLRLLPWTPQGSRLILPWWLAERVPIPPATVPALWQRIAASGVATTVLGWPGSWAAAARVIPAASLPSGPAFSAELDRTLSVALEPFPEHRPDLRRALELDVATVAAATAAIERGDGQVWLHLSSLAEARRWLEPRRPTDTREREVVELIIDIVDGWLNELLARAGPDSLFVVASPYGLAPPGSWERIQRLLGSDEDWRTSAESCPDGLLLVAGPGVRIGGRFDSAAIKDLAPTLCFLLNLPVAQYMEGRVVLDAIDRSYLETHPLRVVD